MASNPPMLITRVHVGRGPGIVLISLASPSGELGAGPVDEVAELFNHTAAQMQGEAGLKAGMGRTPLHALRNQVKN